MSFTISNKCLLLLSLWALLIFPRTLPAIPGFAQGYVYGRAAVTNDEGLFTWGEYNNTNGRYLGDIGLADENLNPAEWRVISGDMYRSIIQQKEDLHEQQQDLELLSRADYEGGDILLASGDPMTKPPLSETTAFVSILPQERRLIDDPQSLILAQYPVNPDIGIGGGIVSILYKYRGDNIGEIHKQSPHRIGFKVAFAKDENGEPILIDDNKSIYGLEFRRGESYPAAPFSDVPVYSAREPGGGVSDENGHFTALWLYPPCPMISMEYTNRLYTKFFYRRFNPKQDIRIVPTWSEHRTIYDYCVAQTYFVPFFGPVPLGPGAINPSLYPVSFIVDRSYLSGVAQLAEESVVLNKRVLLSGDKVLVDDATEFLADEPDNEAASANYYDLDRDGTVDTVVEGHLEDKPIDEGEDACEAKGKTQRFVAGDPKELQGVWLSSSGNTPEDCQPDLTRVIDRESFDDFNNQGLLSKISAEDLRNTDMYVVRLSDGKLIAERIGLYEYDIRQGGRGSGGFGDDEGNSQFFYTMEMRGSQNLGKLSSENLTFEEWSSLSGINPELHERETDRLQPGDALRIFAINRSTGYIGHVDTTYEIGTEVTALLGEYIEPIIMGPPNLRIRVERGYKIEKGISASDEKIIQLVGFEGASLTSDQTVTITTEWLDHEGRPIPESLEGAGYTGRVAILSGDKSLQGGNQGVYQFSIDPGKRLQVLQLPNAITDSEHFYIHISGEPESGNPIFGNSTTNQRLRQADFSSTGQNPGILQNRPDHYVPFLVPIFDETATELQTQAYRLLKDSDPETYNDTPDPIYRWVYRPEMQFTSYDLQVDEINVSNDADKDGNISSDEIINILDQETPLISGSDLLDIVYDLTTTELLPLDYFNAGETKDLIFKLGEQEIAATLDTNQEIKFDDLSHLGALSPDDFFSINLYTNNDLGNSLWEFAFEYLAIFPILDDELNEGTTSENTWFVTADNPIVDLGALLVGYATRDPDIKEPRTLRWEIDGDGSFEPSEETTTDTGFFKTRLDMGTTANSEGLVKVTLDGDPDTETEWVTVVVLPGKPSQISISANSGSAAVQGRGDLTVTATVRDQHGNAVQDGTPVRFYVRGDANIPEYNGLTVGGQTSVTIKGGYFVGDNNQVVAEVDDVSATANFSVRGFNVNVASLPTSVSPNQLIPFSITASSTGGHDTSELFVEAYIDKGNLQRQSLFTDASGALDLVWHTGSSLGEATLTVKLSGNETYSQSVNILGSASSSTPEDGQTLLALGDVSTPGSESIRTLSGSNATISYSNAMAFTMEGTPNATEVVNIGTASSPNRAPLLSYRPGDLIDENQRYVVTMENATLKTTHPTGAGSSIGLTGTDASVRFEESSEILPSQPHINLSVLPGSGYIGELANLNGGLVLRALNNGLRATVTTSDGDFTTELIGIDTANWQQVSLNVRDGLMTLSANGQTSQQGLTGSIDYSPTSGVQLTGQADFSDFRVYDYSTAPLVVDSISGTEDFSVTYDASGQVNTLLTATGNLQSHLPDSRLPMATVGLDHGTASHQFLLVSLSEYIRVVGTLVYDASESIDQASVARFFMDQNQYRDSQLVNRRLMGTRADHNVHSPIQTASLILKMIERLPGSDDIYQSLDNLLTLLQVNGTNDAFVYALIDVVGKAVKQTVEGDRQALQRVQVPLKVLEEMLLYDITAGDFIAQSVRSAHDLRTWFNILNVPAAGWVGTEIPIPDIDNVDCDALTPDIFRNTSLRLSSIPCRLNGEDFADWLNSIARNETLFLSNPNLFVLFLDHLYEGLPFAPTSLRKNLFALEDSSATSSFNLIPHAHAAGGAAAILRPLKWLAKLGSRSAKNAWVFFLGKANHRIPPVAMMFVFYYLSERVDPESNCTGSCKRIQLADPDKDAKEIIDSKIARIMRQIGNAGKLKGDKTSRSGSLQCGFASFTHGDMFELTALAYFHALYEAGDGYYQIVDIEANNTITIADKRRDGSLKEVLELIRRSDVVLAGSGDKPVFVELKSIQAASSGLTRAQREDEDNREKFLRKWPRWSVTRGRRTTYHRQFLLDHMATKAVEIDGEEYNGFASEFKWYFHSWTDYNKIREYTRRGRTVEFDPGVPMDKVGSGTDTDYHRVTRRLIEAPNRRAGQDKVEATLGQDLLLVNSVKYHINPTNIGQHREILSWLDLLNLIQIPPEVEEQLNEITNNLELELILDIIAEYEEIDILPDLPVEAWWETTVEKLGDLGQTFSQCDP